MWEQERYHPHVLVTKVLGRVLIKRVVASTDAESRKDPAGLRKVRGATEQIFVLKNIIDQVAEWNSSLYLCFVDNEKASDSINRDILCKIKSSYGIPPKIVRERFKSCTLTALVQSVVADNG